MNLVAKEFVGARDDERGVLVLSEMTGAARQLHAALLINPYDIDGSAAAVTQALAMSISEQSKQMRLLRTTVAAFSASWWAGQLIEDARRQRDRNVKIRPAGALHLASYPTAEPEVINGTLKSGERRHRRGARPEYG